MYTVENFKSKQAIKEAIAEGRRVRVFQPGLGKVPVDGAVFLEGPHYPEAHRWYAQGILSDGVLVSVK